jgi:hypothetical protein
MANPLTPNFDPNAPAGARLATDRYDFEAHIEGTNFRHKADQIDLFPTLVIDGYGTETTVQGALAALSLLVVPPPVPDATTSSKGIIQLSGDIGGAATNIVVTQIQGKPINTAPPSANDVLTWNGSSWGPAATSNAFSANGDLSGTNVLQHVIGLTGTAGIVSATCNTIDFALGTTPLVTQVTNAAGSGTNLSLIAQGSSFVSGAGGNVIISGGTHGSGGLKGGTKLQLDGYNLVQLSEVIAGQRVLSLLGSGNLTSSDMPVSSGDMVVYVRDILNAGGIIPVAPPTNGTVLFSNGGQLFIQQADGTQFVVGSIPNPSVWGPTGQQTFTHRDFSASPPIMSSTLFSFTLEDNAATKVDVIIIGKDILFNDSAQFNLSMGYTMNAGVPDDVGTLTSSDPRFTLPAGAWVPPTITRVGTTVSVVSGIGPGGVNWFAVTQLSIVAGP